MAEEKIQYADTKSMMKEFARIGQKTPYSFQAKFFLNAYWKELSKEAENVFQFTQLFIELDKKGDKGTCLDEFQAHRVLEKQGTVMTVVEMRNALKEIDLDTDNKMSLLEYCVWRFKVDINELMSRPQGTNKALEDLEEKIKLIQSGIAKVRKYKKKWDGKTPPTEGPKKVIYDQDMSQLSGAEKALEENLDLAMKKLRGASNSKDVIAAGKTWWLQRELEEARKWAAPKKKVVK